MSSRLVQKNDFFVEKIKAAFKKQYEILNNKAIDREISRIYQEMATNRSRVLDIRLEILNEIKKGKILNEQASNKHES